MKRPLTLICGCLLFAIAAAGGRDGLPSDAGLRFGLSGIIPDPAHLETLPVDCATSGFWIGPSADFFGGKKEEVHTRHFRAFIERGVAPIGTFYLGDVGEDEARWAEAIVRYYATGPGSEAIGGSVLYWELGDEQNGEWGTACSPEEYARRVSVLAPAIRRGCPECSIVMGGLLDGPEMGDWALIPYMRAFLASGGGAWIDVYAFHYFGLARPDLAWPGAQLYDSAEEIVLGMRSALASYGLEESPIWVTETSTYSGRVGVVEQSERDQAADLVKRYVTLWSLGVDAVLWCYLTEPTYEGTGTGFFDQSGLIYDGLGPYDRGAGVKKRAFDAYKGMIDRLAGARCLERTSDEGVTICRFLAQGEPVTVLWQDPWVREGPIWISAETTILVSDLYGEGLVEFRGTTRLDLGIEPVYVLGELVQVSTTAPALRGIGS